MSTDKAVSKFIYEIDEFREQFPDDFLNEYEELREQLEDILEIFESNEVIAKKNFNDMPLAKFDSFEKYVCQSNPSMLYKTGVVANDKVKTLRAKRKDLVCPMCGEPINENKCRNCEYDGDDGNVSTKNTSENTRHINKQFDAFIGSKNPPSNIVKIIDVIKDWLLDLSHLYEFLKSTGRLKEFLKEIAKVNTGEGDAIDVTWFDQTPTEPWNYNTFRLMMNEFHNMLEYCKRFSKYHISDVNAMDKESIVEMFCRWREQNETGTPKSDEIFEGKEIGIYVAELMLLPNVDEDHIKNSIQEVLDDELSMPGLTFNFNQRYSKSDNIPWNFNFQQEFVYIIHETFQVPYINLTAQDKEAAIQLVLKFNEYCKNESYINTGKMRNSPLYCITVERIFNSLPYFWKYRGITRFLPMKDFRTVDEISKSWLNFMQENPELIGRYLTV
jgi:hypothetical protein